MNEYSTKHSIGTKERLCYRCVVTEFVGFQFPMKMMTLYERIIDTTTTPGIEDSSDEQIRPHIEETEKTREEMLS